MSSLPPAGPFPPSLSVRRMHTLVAKGCDFFMALINRLDNTASVTYNGTTVSSNPVSTLLLLPGSLMIGASELFTRGNPSSLDRIMAVMGMAMGVCLLILGGITAWIFTRRYALAPYLVIRQDSLTARQAIRESIQATRGFKTSYAWFQFSFIGWWLFSLFMLPLFYTIPYVWGGNALYARTLLEARRVIPRPGEAAQPA